MTPPLRNDETGLSILEGALVMPILAMLLFGIIQWGLILAVMIGVKTASAVGARTYSLSPTPTNQQIAAAVDEALVPLVPAGAATTVPTEITAGGFAGAKQVVVRYDLPLFLPFVVPTANQNGSYTISATSVAR